MLGLDLVILDNDDAEQREQVRPTYKKLKGFWALNMTWENLVLISLPIVLLASITAGAMTN